MMRVHKFLLGVLFGLLLIALVVVAGMAINEHAKDYNSTFDAACRSRGGEPVQLSRERICVAKGVFR